jgi:galactokinase
MSQLEFIITRLKRFLNDPEKIVRNLIAINETKLKAFSHCLNEEQKHSSTDFQIIIGSIQLLVG